MTEEKYNKWTTTGRIHEICCFCALICFSFSLIILANVLIELEFAKHGFPSSANFVLGPESAAKIKR